MNAKESFDAAEQARIKEELDRAAELYQQAQDEAGDDVWTSAESRHMQGVIAYQREDYDRATQLLNDALAMFEEHDMADLVGSTLRDLGSVALAQKDYEQAKQYVEKSIAVLKETTNVGHLGISHVKLGQVYAAEGDLEAAERTMREGIEELEKSDETFFLAQAYQKLAEVEKAQGKDPTEDATRALEILNQQYQPDQHTAFRQKIEELL